MARHTRCFGVASGNGSAAPGMTPTRSATLTMSEPCARASHGLDGSPAPLPLFELPHPRPARRCPARCPCRSTWTPRSSGSTFTSMVPTWRRRLPIATAGIRRTSFRTALIVSRSMPTARASRWSVTHLWMWSSPIDKYERDRAHHETTRAPKYCTAAHCDFARGAPHGKRVCGEFQVMLRLGSDADAFYDARQLGAEFSLPFFIINGPEDQVAPTDLAAGRAFMPP